MGEHECVLVKLHTPGPGWAQLLKEWGIAPGTEAAARAWWSAWLRTWKEVGELRGGWKGGY